MLVELLVLGTLIFLIAILFYKQRRKDLQILQLEQDQIPVQLSDLLEEQQPIVIRGITPPRGLTAEGLAKAPRLASFPVGGQPLSSVLQAPTLLASAAGLPTLSLALRTNLADELAFPIWATHNWRSHFAQISIMGSMIGTMRTEAVIGGMGMWKTTAKLTTLMPTEGTYAVSILSVDSEQFLPKAWQYRYVTSLTPNDTPLVADIKFLDIVLRPGTALVLPPHTIVSMEPRDSQSFSAAAILEYHEPISLLAKSFADA
jgi:hypothetical protein